MGVRKGSLTGICPRLEIGIKKQIFLSKPEVGILIPINWFDSCNSFFRHETHSAQESDSQLQRHAVMSLAEPFWKWGETSARQKTMENFVVWIENCDVTSIENDVIKFCQSV